MLGCHCPSGCCPVSCPAGLSTEAGQPLTAGGRAVASCDCPALSPGSRLQKEPAALAGTSGLASVEPMLGPSMSWGDAPGLSHSLHCDSLVHTSPTLGAVPGALGNSVGATEGRACKDVLASAGAAAAETSFPPSSWRCSESQSVPVDAEPREGSRWRSNLGPHTFEARAWPLRFILNAAAPGAGAIA